MTSSVLTNPRGRVLARALVFVLLLVLVAGFLVPGAAAQEDEEQTKVHAVFNYSPTCGHCEYVMYNLLFPFTFPENGGEAVIYFDTALEEAGEEIPFYIVTNGSLEMLFVDVSTEEGGEFFIEASRTV